MRRTPQHKTAVVTGAGVSRTVAEAFALLSREPERLAHAAITGRLQMCALAVPTDLADTQAIETAAARVERKLGEIDVRVNVAMATIFAPVSTRRRATAARCASPSGMFTR